MAPLPPSQEDQDLALQREALRRRHLEGGEDSLGDDPGIGEGSTTPATHDVPSAAEPVRLELGVDAEMLEIIIAEIEVNFFPSEIQISLSQIIPWIHAVSC